MHTLTKRAGATTAGLLLAGVVVALTADPAAATETPAPVCKTSTTTMVDRPDSGLHGDWATDAMTRIVKICEGAPAAPDLTVQDITAQARVLYTATVTDTGTFATVAGHSPVAGAPLAAGVTGKLTGGYTATFTARPGFRNYRAALDGVTFHGDEGPSTTDWVRAAWGGNDFRDVTNLVAWKWTYWTCSAELAGSTEHWINADPDVNEGDITGRPCPSPSASPSASAPAAPTATATAAPGAGGGLPVTGFPVPVAVGVAGALVVIGAALMMAARRRRHHFDSAGL